MTCIAAVAHEGKVWMGGDSAGVAGWDLNLVAGPKVFARGDMVVGYTTSFRMGQLIQHAMDVSFFTSSPGTGLARYMATDFVDGLRECLKEGGWAERANEQESGGTFLVGVAGRLFGVQSDYAVLESKSGYDACGCGFAYARGSLFSSAGLPPRDRVRLALRAAERHSGGVRGPFAFAASPAAGVPR